MFLESFKEVISKSIPFKDKELVEQVQMFIEKRLGDYIKCCKYFYLEEDYVDVNWRTIYSHHYSKTYYSECSPYSSRVHFFLKDDISDIENYYGYIVIRPIPTVFALSKIVLRPMHTIYKSEDIYLMTAPHDVNIYVNGVPKTLTVNAWPMQIQDTVAQVCADACLNMTTCYLSKRYPDDFPHYWPANLLPNNISRRPIPSYGLTVYEISQILVNNGYRAYVEVFNEHKDFNRFVDSVDSNIESSLPVILAYKNHVSVIAGHTGSGNKKYIIYDDSGSHLKCIGDSDPHSFTGTIDLKKIDWTKGVFTISFEFDKVFLRSDALTQLMKTKAYSNFNPKRKLLIEFKELLRIIDNLGYSYNEILHRRPHYVWLVDGDCGAYVVDAAAHKYDAVYSLIGVVDDLKKPIGLLNKITKCLN